MNKTDSRVTVKNHILSSLSEKDCDELLSDLQPVSLTLSQVIYEMGDTIDYVHFPNSGMCSLVSHTKDGNSLEVGMVGHDGVIDLAAFLGDEKIQYRVIVQGEGDALRVRADAFKKACKQSDSLRTVMLRYTQAVMAQLNQAALCNRFHPIESRLCRWLLQSQDVVQSNELQLTQEFISYMLGVRRAGITVAAGAVQSLGLIRYNRGHITILDREGLKVASCECYEIISETRNKYLAV
jgi:CRP-like cAMP-binding protein